MISLADYKHFTPFELAKGLVLKNRIVYAPTTRARAEIDTHAPNERMCIYNELRASAGLIIAEACAVSEQGFGWWGAPALYNDEQAAGWKTLVDCVHAKDGKIFVQLQHMGRQSHPSFNSKNEVVSASATLCSTGRTRDATGKHAGFATARALEEDEIPAIVEDFRKCAELAKAAGFDGVEIHSANGYLIDQFLQSSTNFRTDKYGGSFENRYRFLGEIVDTLKTVYLADRIGVRMSPNGAFGDMGSHDNFDMFSYAFKRLSVHGLAYLSVLEGVYGANSDKTRLVTAFDAKQAFKGTIIANNSLVRDTAEGVLRSGSVDLACFSRLFMANPDLVERFRNDWQLNAPIEYEFYWDAHKTDEGYLTLPVYNKADDASEQTP